MSRTMIILGCLAAVPLAMGMLLLFLLRSEEKLELRIAEVRERADQNKAHAIAPTVSRMVLPVALLGGLIARSGILSVKTLADLQVTLQTAGLRGQSGLSIFVGAKLLLLLGLPVAMFATLTILNWWPTLWFALIGASAVIGMLAPDFIVRRRRKNYLYALEQGLPDALDMLVICSEAGLGLEAAFEQVGSEIGQGHPVIALEMQMTLQEMRINPDRRSALLGLGRRTGLASLKRLGSTLVQTMQFGTPLSQALRTLSGEMRQEMLIRFESQAARLPVLLTLPMIVFILPCVFLVVGGPAIVQVMQIFQK